MDPHVTGSHRGSGKACRKAQRRRVGWSAVEWTGAQGISCISNCRAKRRKESRRPVKCCRSGATRWPLTQSTSGAPRTHCGRSGDSGEETVVPKLPNQQVHLHRPAACTVPQSPTLRRFNALLSLSSIFFFLNESCNIYFRSSLVFCGIFFFFFFFATQATCGNSGARD